MSGEKVPTYTRIANDIRTSILSGHISPENALPTENDLAKRYETSRVTVRKALNILCNENLIFSHQGKGYFVLKPEYNNYSMYFDLTQPDLEIRYDKMTVMDAPEDVRTILGLPEGRLVILLQLTLCRAGLPVACEDKYLVYNKGIPSIESVIHYADFQDMVDERLLSHQLHCSLHVYPALPDEAHARLLRCGMDEPLLVVTRTIISDRGSTVGYGLAYLRGEYGGLSAFSGYSSAKPMIPSAMASQSSPGEDGL